MKTNPASPRTTSHAGSGNRPEQRGRLPGAEGIWVLVAVDSFVFALLFASFMHARREDPNGFEIARQSLDADLGGTNTLILLTSSWAVATAIHALRANLTQRAVGYLVLAVGTGSLFVGLKTFEYVEKLAAGSTPATNDFFMWYFVLTGIHLVHVLLGLGLLLHVVWGTKAGTYGSGRPLVPESVATFWHLVDFLWIVIFPLLYLMKAG